jgi:hypothetical protein
LEDITMRTRTAQYTRFFFILSLGALLTPSAIAADEPAGTTPKKAQEAPAQRDGQHDFDFLMGSWKTHLSRLVKPLTGSTTWIESDGTIVARPIWNGLANIDELEADGPNGHIQGLTLRLYNPETRQWSLYWANSKNGTLAMPPNVGAFKNGRGEFFDQEMFEGRSIIVRYAWSDITEASARFVQSFSEDGGKTWEDNWISTLTRAQK